jgi:hypothetical protein
MEHALVICKCPTDTDTDTDTDVSFELFYYLGGSGDGMGRASFFFCFSCLAWTKREGKKIPWVLMHVSACVCACVMLITFFQRQWVSLVWSAAFERFL